jgi:hypothetical protein
VARITDKDRRDIVINRITERVRSDTRFKERMENLGDQYPEYFPLTTEVLASGLSIEFVLELARLARDVGLDRLPAPWFMLADQDEH